MRSTPCLHRSTRLCFLLSILLIPLLSACGSSQPAQKNESDRTVQPDDSQTDTERLESLFWERQRSSRDRFTEADEHFMVGMIAHHSQALIMTELARTNHAGEEVMQMARRIENTQYDEIATMQQWLRDRALPVPVVSIEGIDMTIEMEMPDGGEMPSVMNGAMVHHHNMPGMLSRDQLSRMADATGEAFDEHFLRYMIEHHQGAIYMVQDLLAAEGAAQHPETFRLASDIHADQQMEIERMGQMLLAMGSRVPENPDRSTDPHNDHHH
ncbi:MAG: DUF305 domain-containing protein [Balneolaceae bacterium]